MSCGDTSVEDDAERFAWAAIPFDADLTVTLDDCMSNEQLGRYMVQVRLAVLTLNESKAALVEKVATEFKEKGEEDLLVAFLADLRTAQQKFEGLAGICEEASRRLLIAAHCVE